MFQPRRAVPFVVRHSVLSASVSSCVLVAVALFAGALVVAGVAAVELLLLGFLIRRARETWQARTEAWKSHASSLAAASTLDEETGLGNFRGFEFEWWHHLARFKRRLEPFTVALVEVAGAAESRRELSSAVLREVGSLLLQTARSEDTVFRVDSRIFAVLLADAGRQGGQEFVDRARIAISSKPLNDEGRAVHVITRVGVAEWQPETGSMVRMLEAAEQDLRQFGDEKRRQEAYFQPDATPPPGGAQRRVS